MIVLTLVVITGKVNVVRDTIGGKIIVQGKEHDTVRGPSQKVSGRYNVPFVELLLSLLGEYVSLRPRPGGITEGKGNHDPAGTVISPGRG